MDINACYTIKTKWNIPPLQKNIIQAGMGMGWTSPGSACGYMYVNDGTIIVGNDLKNEKLVAWAKPQKCPMLIYQCLPPPPQKKNPEGFSISFSTNERLSYGGMGIRWISSFYCHRLSSSGDEKGGER